MTTTPVPAPEAGEPSPLSPLKRERGAPGRRIPFGLTRDDLLDIYYYMRLTRSLEERLTSLYRQGKIPGGLYRSLGQEAEAVASAYALEPGDLCSPVIRNLGSMLVLGARPVDVLRQYLAKAEGPTRGRDLHLMFSDLEAGYVGHIAPLGAMLPVIAGVALSFKLRSEPRVALAYTGDGATSTGAFHEGINFAAVQRLPLVVVVEHNGYAYSTPTKVETAVERLADKAKAYGILGLTVDGNDALQVYDATRRAVARARAGDGVTLIEAVTYRMAGHAEHDDQRYQSREEIAAWERRDPIVLYVERVFAAGWAHPAEFRSINARVTAELDAALEASEPEPMPAPATALTDVYAPATPAPAAPPEPGAPDGAT